MKRRLKTADTAETLDLRTKLAELEETLAAIRSGEVDALIVNGPNGDHVYSLKGAEQPYREFIERMAEGAVTLDPRGTILYCNRRFAEMINLPMERAISSNLLRRVARPDRELLARMLAGSEAASANVQLLPAGKKGASLPVRIATSTLESAEITARCAVVSDLTEHYERQALAEALANLKESRASLEKQYNEVQQIRARLEAASAAKDQFLAALSHELRTPLTPVLLTANALAVDASLPPELRGDLDMIRRNVELEARLIDDLLDLTRITTGKLQLSPECVDLHDTLALALDICQSDTAAKQLRFRSRLDAPRHFVSGEAVRLQQVFWNLIRNAVKFTPAAGSITVSTRNLPAEPGKPPAIQVSVADTGIGIAKTARNQIFEAFQQGSRDINRRFGGLGLGLTISRHLVELHGGTISAASRGPGKGATFTITLPTIPASLPAMASVPRALLSGRQALRILLVEDHDDTRRNMARLLTALSHSVVAAPDAASALDYARSSSFDLVISDIGLPDESGLELMKKLRARHGLRGICLSGYGMEEDIARSREAGFSEHLTKPINFQRLESAIAQAAADRPPHAESALDSRKKSSPPGTNGYSAPARSKRPRSTNSRARLAP